MVKIFLIDILYSISSLCLIDCVFLFRQLQNNNKYSRKISVILRSKFEGVK